MIASYNQGTAWGVSKTILKTDRIFEELEMDDMELSRLVVGSLLTYEMREKMRISFDHHADFLDYRGGVSFSMALDIFNASVSFDIEGAQEKIEALALDDFPGEDLT
jgi:hypothetical protein